MAFIFHSSKFPRVVEMSSIIFYRVYSVSTGAETGMKAGAGTVVRTGIKSGTKVGINVEARESTRIEMAM